ncbi:P-loop NTPase fold protein [Orbus mooreae]|uniref:P-loop NTPase fold protein n=1 Tax=Orbus mooreae TaxID=3074107 RepID=UPI00370CFDED
MPKILKNRFLLDLNRSLSSPLSDSEQNNLQKEVFNDVHKLLTKFCTEIADNETPITFGLKRKNNVIYVHGARGAGKTTFLREILNFYQNTQSDNRIQNIKKIYPVAFIDPTLIDTHHSILVEIIGHFYSLVDEQLSFCQNPEKRIEFYKLLDLISNGMELFVTNETKYTECDASRHLTRTSNQPMLGRHLEKKINILIDEVSKILNIELFIVAIDDIDTNTDKAYEILEAIRCYLNHPRLAIIISGDLKMYSVTVNKNWRAS